MKKLLANNWLILLFFLFTLTHLVLLNINAAEWGDSYRILRASQFVKHFTYPTDEKRPPLFSIFLAVQPSNMNPVLFGRVFMFIVSLVSLYVFYKILNQVFKDKQKIITSLLLFIFNPVYLYWSIRVMADTFFLMFVLLVSHIYISSVNKKKLAISNLIYLGILSGLSILTRFEGYILFISLLIGVLLFDTAFSFSVLKSFRKALNYILLGFKKNVLSAIIYILSTVLVLVPYWIYRNPFNSAYFEEPSRRVYDLNTLLIYLGSFIFLFGFMLAILFLSYSKRYIVNFMQKYLAFFSFISIELMLVLAWPAAIPRLFIPIIPFILIFISNGVVDFFKSKNNLKKNTQVLLYTSGIIIFYVLIQYKYKLQFLILLKPILILVLILNVFSIYFIYQRKLSYYIGIIVFSCMLWALATIWIHKDIFKVVKEANEYVVNNLTGVVGYNDVSSVSDWYLNQANISSNVSGFYYDLIIKENKLKENIQKKNLNYILVTNEHNTDLTIDVSAYPYLTQIYDYESMINGKLFFTKIYQVDL